jgi:alanine-glyoxylate transaminase/serine-glyoxylate transaminase/serine-pyruvate transaminase
VGGKALSARRTARLPRSYWDWEPMLAANGGGYFPYTPATNLLYGLREALRMLEEEGLDAVFARHARLASATRAAVAAWGLETQCADPREHSGSLTAVRVPEGHDADALRRVILERCDTSLGNGLGRLKGRVFRIGHLGAFNEPMLAGTLGAIEIGLAASGVPFRPGGLGAALDHLAARRIDAAP